MRRCPGGSLRDLAGSPVSAYRFLREPDLHAEHPPEGRPTHWSPSVDIYEAGNAFVLVAEIPGLVQEEIRVEVADDVLTLQGERPLCTASCALGYHRLERPNGAFCRAFRLPEDVDQAAVSATYRDGILRVALPKRRDPAGRAIEVDVGG